MVSRRRPSGTTGRHGTAGRPDPRRRTEGRRPGRGPGSSCRPTPARRAGRHAAPARSPSGRPRPAPSAGRGSASRGRIPPPAGAERPSDSSQRRFERLPGAGSDQVSEGAAGLRAGARRFGAGASPLSPVAAAFGLALAAPAALVRVEAWRLRSVLRGTGGLRRRRRGLGPGRGPRLRLGRVGSRCRLGILRHLGCSRRHDPGPGRCPRLASRSLGGTFGRGNGSIAAGRGYPRRATRALTASGRELRPEERLELRRDLAPRLVRSARRPDARAPVDWRPADDRPGGCRGRRVRWSRRSRRRWSVRTRPDSG